jgi:hypothetical protein
LHAQKQVQWQWQFTGKINKEKKNGKKKQN